MTELFMQLRQLFTEACHSTPFITPAIFGWMLPNPLLPASGPYCDGRDLLALADGAEHLDLALQLHSRF